jgi:hypothetical protein
MDEKTLEAIAWLNDFIQQGKRRRPKRMAFEGEENQTLLRDFLT